MPIIWRYLLKQYLKVLSLAVTTFVALLFVSRLKQLAEFASMGAGGSHIAVFALFLIPYILPLAIPIACLIASVLLFQKLSRSSELVAMRACGLSFRTITAPVLLAGVALSLVNFYAASELSTHCHMLGRKMQSQQSTINPLMMLQNPRVLALGDLYVDMRSGDAAEEVTLVGHNRGTGRLSVITADRLEVKDNLLHGENVGVVTTVDDHLVIENEEEMWTPTDSFGHFLRRVGLYLKNSHLKMRFLLIRIAQNGDIASYVEIARRVSLALAAFTFTLMGCAYGIQIGRRASKRGMVMVILLATFFIGSFSIGNGISNSLALALTLTLVPHLVIVALCIRTLRRVTRGVA